MLEADTVYARTHTRRQLCYVTPVSVNAHVIIRRQGISTAPGAVRVWRYGIGARQWGGTAATEFALTQLCVGN
jgi:hypothetical protein